MVFFEFASWNNCLATKQAITLVPWCSVIWCLSISVQTAYHLSSLLSSLLLSLVLHWFPFLKISASLKSLKMIPSDLLQGPRGRFSQPRVPCRARWGRDTPSGAGHRSQRGPAPCGTMAAPPGKQRNATQRATPNQQEIHKQPMNQGIARHSHISAFQL